MTNNIRHGGLTYPCGFGEPQLVVFLLRKLGWDPFFPNDKGSMSTTEIGEGCTDLGRRITQSTDDHRESAFPYQRLSVLIQHYNAFAVIHTTPYFSPLDPYYRGRKKITPTANRQGS